MRASRLQFLRAMAVLLLIAGISLPAAAQRRGPRPHHDPGPRPGTPRKEPKAENKKGAESRALAGLPPQWLERVQDMSPEQQQRFLNNNEHFKSLSPDRQAAIRNRLGQWNNLTPEQRLAVRERKRIWDQLSPEQQRHVREELLPKWRQMSPDRRQALLGKLHTLKGLNEAERSAKLNDPAFLQGLSPDERGMLGELSHLQVGSAPEPPQEN